MLVYIPFGKEDKGDKMDEEAGGSTLQKSRWGSGRGAQLLLDHRGYEAGGADGHAAYGGDLRLYRPVGRGPARLVALLRQAVQQEAGRAVRGEDDFAECLLFA